MNKGTIIRTVLVIATCFNTALMATDVAQFHNESVNLVYRILSLIANFVIVFCATYYNNDYTKEAAIGTGITRQLKLEQKENYIGDYFYTNEDEVESDDELEVEVSVVNEEA